MQIYIINGRGDRLCRDNHFRGQAFFGSFSYCVKAYTDIRYAKRKALKLQALVVAIPDSMIIESSGLVIETKPCEDKPGYVNYIHHDIKDFVIFDAQATAPTACVLNNIE
jgi:hypothetical protein